MTKSGNTGLNMAIFSIVSILIVSTAFAVVMQPIPPTQNSTINSGVNYTLNITNNIGASPENYSLTLFFNSSAGSASLNQNVTTPINIGQSILVVLSVISNYTGPFPVNITAIGNSNASDTNSIIVNTGFMPDPFPMLSVQWPTNGSSYSNFNISLNYTVADNGPVQCRYTNTTGQTIQLPGCLNTSFMAPTYGNWNIMVYVNDSMNQTNFTIINFSVIDNIPPIINLTTANNTVFPSGLGNLSFSADDPSLPINCTLYTNAYGTMSPVFSAIVPPAPNITTVSLPGPACNGNYFWYVSCSDNAAAPNSNMSEIRSFSVNQSINGSCPGQGSILGYVKNIADNTTIPGAKVWLNDGSVFNTTTDGSGYYDFINMPIGIYDVWAQANNISPPSNYSNLLNLSYQGKYFLDVNISVIQQTAGGGGGGGINMSWFDFIFPQMPYAANGEDTGLPIQGDIGAVWVTTNATHYAFQIFAPNLTGATYCNGPNPTTINIEIDADAVISTGCNWTSNCFKGADYSMILGTSKGNISFSYFNQTIGNWTPRTANVTISPDISSNCSVYPTVMRFAIAKADLGNPSKPELQITTRFTNNTVIDKLMPGMMAPPPAGMEDRSGCPIYDGNQSACENSLNTIGTPCIWKTAMMWCEPNFTAMNTCDYFCGMCLNQTSCISSSPQRPPCEWMSGSSICVENPLMTQRGANCENDCFSCFDQYNCESKGSGGSTCAWRTDPFNASRGMCDYGAGAAIALGGGMERSPPTPLGIDAVGDVLGNQSSFDILGFGIKEGTFSYGLGVPVMNATNLSICGGGINGKFAYYMDSDNNVNTGDQSINSSFGFEYKVIFNTSDNTNSLYIWNASASAWAFNKSSALAGDELGILASMACSGDNAVVTLVKKSDIGNPKDKINFYVTAQNASNITIDQAGPFRYSPGTIDFKPIDCFLNPMSCGSAFAMIGGGQFMPFEDCIAPGDEDGDGLVGSYVNGVATCNDPDCFMAPWCLSAATSYALTDTKAPFITLNSVDKFTDFAFIQWITDEPANGTLSFHGTNSTCTNNTVLAFYDLGDPGSSYDDYKPFHGVALKNNSAYNSTLNLSIKSNTAYYYKTTSCDKAGNCAISGCLNFTTLATEVPVPLKMDFAPLAGTVPTDYLGNMQFQFVLSNGTVQNLSYQNFNTSQNFTHSDNVTMKLTNPSATSPWFIDLVGINIAKTKNINFTNAMVVKDLSDSNNVCPGATCKFVGMNSSIWQDLAQNLGVTKLKLKIPFSAVSSTPSQLQKCDDNGANCVNATGCVLISNESTTTYQTWECPVSLGFSVFAVYMAETITTTNTGTTTGSTTPATTPVNSEIHSWDVIYPGLETTYSPTNANLAIAQIAVEPYSNANNVKMTLTALTQKPSDASDITGKFIFKWLSISLENLANNNIKTATIKFKVANSWMSGNNVDENSIKLLRYSNSAWTELQTVKASKDSLDTTYQATTPGFSYFAITGTQLSSQNATTNITQNLTQNTTTPASSAQPGACGNTLCESNESQANCCADCGCPQGQECKNGTCQETAPAAGVSAPQVSVQEASSSLLIIAAVVIIIVVVLLVYLFVLRKKSSKGYATPATTAGKY